MYRLADIYKQYWDEFLKKPQMHLRPRMFKAVNQTMACQTKKLGTRVYKCTECEKKKIIHHSCKNRFCPRCGFTASSQWAEQLVGILAPIRHHHVVFTLPEGLLPLIHRYPKVTFNALFSSASWVLKEWFSHKHNLTPGIVTVLHTAGFALKKHIHLHVLVTGGGIRGGRWHELTKNYLTRIDYFRKRFRWRFEHDLLASQKRGDLPLHSVVVAGMTETSEMELKRLFVRLNDKQWVVSVQKGIRQPERIVRYIGRYIKRAPFSEQSIQEMNDGIIRFESKNSRGNSHRVIVRLPVDEFLRRLLSHVPLEGFHQVRYYGAYQSKKSDYIVVHSHRVLSRLSWRQLQIQHSGIDPLMCPNCGCEMVYCGMEFPEVTYAKTG